MPRPRKPTTVLEASGYFRKHPERRRENEPVVTEALCGPPGHLLPDEVRAYQEIAELAPVGVLTRADSLAVELTARMMATVRRDRNVNAALLTQLQRALGRLGMDPSSRAGMSIPKAKAPNPFDDL